MRNPDPSQMTGQRTRPWTTKEYCEFMDITHGAAAQQRYKGTGPKFIRVGSRIYYDPIDVFAYLDANKLQRTDDRPGAA